MIINRPTRDSYQINLTASEFETLSATLRVLRTGFINWLAGKGKRTQDQYVACATESEKTLTVFGKATEAPVQPAKPSFHTVADYKASLIARIGSLCGTLSEGNITEGQSETCKAAALSLLAYGLDAGILSADEADKWGNAIAAAAAYGQILTRAKA